MQTLLIQPTIPRTRNLALRVSRPGHDKPTVLFAVRRLLRRRRIRNDIHAHGLGHPRYLASYTAISQHAQSLPDQIPHMVQMHVGVFAAPFLLFLQVVQEVVAVALHERGHDHPFGDLRAVDPAAGCECYVGVCVDGAGGEMVYAGGEDVDEVEVGCVGGGGGHGGEGAEDCDVFVDFL